jgi:hypothetical protein
MCTPALNNSVKNNLFWETELDPLLVEKQQLLDQRKLPLTVNPAIPSQEYNLDEKRAQQWIEACEGEYKFLAEKLYKNIQHKRLNAFKKNLVSVSKLSTKA